jgi:hypothetical protein
MKIVSIDPGTKTGIAFFQDGQYFNFLTVLGPLSAITFIDSINPDRVICEDSRMQSHVFTAPGLNAQARLKIARNIGMVDMCCTLIEMACAERKIDYVAISPKEKGKKINAEQLHRITGISSPTNQHERDAIMLGWNYR